VSGLPLPHVQHLVLPGNNGYFGPKGAEDFLALGGLTSAPHSRGNFLY